MKNISGNYTIKIAEKDAAAGGAAGTVITVEVTTHTADHATTIAGVLGTALEQLGLSIAQVDSATPS